MQLHLVRHAESENNARQPELRIEDPAITEKGRRQAEFLADWTRTIKIDVLITSPFRRALETTHAILEHTPRQTLVWHDIFERGGCYRGYHPADLAGAEGLDRHRIASHLPIDEHQVCIDDEIGEQGWWAERTPETDEEAQHRAGRVAERLETTFGSSGQTIVAVTHADFKRLLLGALLPGVVNASELGPLRNTGITKVDFDGNRWRLDWFNSVSHLPGDLITAVET